MRTTGAMLASLRRDSMTVTRMADYKTDHGETRQRQETVYQDVRCRLSFSATDQPTDMDRIPDMRYTATLFHDNDVELWPGDRVTISKEGRVYTGIAGISAVYPSHTETPLALHER